MIDWIVGIDPGADGAICLMSPEHSPRLYNLKDKSEQEIAHLIRGLTINVHCRAFLELVHSRPGQGVKSMFSFGRNLGFLRGVLVTLGIPFEDVPAQRWQKGIGMGKTYPTQTERKKAHKQQAEQWFPSLRVTQANADAVLIAEYGWRQLYRKG